MRMAATNPPRHRLTTGPAHTHSPSVLHDMAFGTITCQWVLGHKLTWHKKQYWTNGQDSSAQDLSVADVRQGRWPQRQQQHGTLPALNSSNSTLKAPSIGAQDTSSIGRTVSPSVASKKVAPFAFSLQQPLLSPCGLHLPQTIWGQCSYAVSLNLLLLV